MSNNCCMNGVPQKDKQYQNACIKHAIACNLRSSTVATKFISVNGTPITETVVHDDSIQGLGVESDPLSLHIQHDFNLLQGSGTVSDPLILNYAISNLPGLAGFFSGFTGTTAEFRSLLSNPPTVGPGNTNQYVVQINPNTDALNVEIDAGALREAGFVGGPNVPVDGGFRVDRLIAQNPQFPGPTNFILEQSSSMGGYGISMGFGHTFANTGLLRGCNIRGGESNSMTIGQFSVICGGLNNDISGGLNPQNYDSIIGGSGNHIQDDYCVILGGQGNIAGNGGFKGIMGGLNNDVLSTSQLAQYIIGGRDNNTSSRNNTFIGGGFSNGVNGDGSGIVGGYDNLLSEDGSQIGGGRNHTTQSSDAFGVIMGGRANQVGFGSAVGGGFNNNADEDNNTIIGGRDNSMALPGTLNLSCIGGGQSNTISRQLCTIVGGQGNAISGAGESNIILGGLNCISSGTRSIVAGNAANDNSLTECFVFADFTGSGMTATNSDTFNLGVRGGVQIDIGQTVGPELSTLADVTGPGSAAWNYTETAVSSPWLTVNPTNITDAINRMAIQTSTLIGGAIA